MKNYLYFLAAALLGFAAPMTISAAHAGHHEEPVAEETMDEEAMDEEHMDGESADDQSHDDHTTEEHKY